MQRCFSGDPRITPFNFPMAFRTQRESKCAKLLTIGQSRFLNFFVTSKLFSRSLRTNIAATETKLTR